MGRASLARRFYIGQEWQHKEHPSVIVRVKMVHRKDRAVQIVTTSGDVVVVTFSRMLTLYNQVSYTREQLDD